MADIVLNDAIDALRNLCSINNGPIWTDTLTSYFFYIRLDSGGQQLFYKKTDDAWVTEGSEITLTLMAGVGFAVWFDQWTKGDTGTKIHIVAMTSLGDVNYMEFDTADDTFLASVSVVDLGETNAVGVTWAQQQVGITKARGGNLYIAAAIHNIATGNFAESFERSTDDGVTWASRATLFDTQTGSNPLDAALLIPGNDPDAQDIYIAYWDVSVTTISLKVYDDNANSFSETTIATGMTAHSAEQFRSFQATQRHSDGHMLLAALSDINSASGDMRFWDINGAISITEKTNVFTNEDTHHGCHVMIDQGTKRIYVTYFGTTAETYANMKVYYKTSDDGGVTWGSETLFNDGAVALVRTLWGDIGPGRNGGRFMPAWHIATDNDNLTNTANSITINATPATLGQVGLACYVPLNGISEEEVTFDLFMNEWREKIETKALALNLPKLENEPLSLNYAVMTIQVKGTVSRLHAAHPVSNPHKPDLIDLEEAAIRFNTQAPKCMATLSIPLVSGLRSYKGIIERMTIVENPGTELIDYILTFKVAWNAGTPPFRGWA